jgi:putative transposase
MLLCVRWHVAYPLSLRNLEEMMQERGVFVDHSTIHRWVIKLVPVLEEAFHKRKRKRGIGAVGKSWRLDETYIKISGEDRYWYRAVDKQGNTVDFLLTATRDRRAARRFFTRAVKNNRLPKIVNIGPSRGQAHHAPDTRLQGLSLCANHSEWRRPARQCC